MKTTILATVALGAQFALAIPYSRFTFLHANPYAP
jgi:hypothetical protein